MTATDLRKQQVLHADPKATAIQQIDSSGNLEVATSFFVLQKVK